MVTKKAGFKSIEKNNQNTPQRDSGLESLLNSEHTVQIEKMAVGGDGVARIQHQQKSLVVFIGKTAPKDIVKIKITATEKNFLTGKIVEIITPGEARRVPPCPYATQCGGCSWQQISDDEQIVQKENILKELFAKFVPKTAYQLQKPVKSPLTFHYRNRIQLKSLKNQLGYFKEKSHDIVDIEACLIADKKISDEIPKLKAQLKSSDDVVKYELKINQNHAFEYSKIGEKGQGLSFAQVNTSVNSLLSQQIVEISEKIKPSRIIELYAGSGNFTFAIASQLASVQIEAVELNSKLTQAATKIIATNGLQKKITFFTADCDSFVSRRSLSSDLIVLDPPRSGCSDLILEKIIQSGCLNILYVSCHPVSLVRDLQKLDLEKNGFTVSWLQVFDMFPQTDHFETLIWLSKNQT